MRRATSSTQGSGREPTQRAGARRRQPAVVAEHHRGRRRRAPRLATAAVLGELAAVHHLRVARDVEHDAGPDAGRGDSGDRRREPGRDRAHEGHRGRRRRRAGSPHQPHLELVGRRRTRPPSTCRRRRGRARPTGRAPRCAARACRDEAQRPSTIHRDVADAGRHSHPDLDPAVLRRHGRPRGDQLGEAEARRRPRARSTSRRRTSCRGRPAASRLSLSTSAPCLSRKPDDAPVRKAGAALPPGERHLTVPTAHRRRAAATPSSIPAGSRQSSSSRRTSSTLRHSRHSGHRTLRPTSRHTCLPRVLCGWPRTQGGAARGSQGP